MKPAHDKFCDRTYSDNLEVGIPLAIETLNDPESHRDDLMAAACYLAYRVIDGNYHDPDFSWKKLNDALELSKTMNDSTDPLWFQTRWRVSLSLVYAYFDVIVRKNPLPREILQECVTEEHVSNHPLQTVNVMRAQLLLAADELFKMGPVDRIVCQDLIEKYSLRAVNLLRLASEKFQLLPGRESNYVYCFSESMEAINEIIKLKYCYNMETNDNIENIIKDLQSLLGKRGKAQYRETIIKMYENRKKHQRVKNLPKMNVILDLHNKKVAYSTTSKCGSRTVIGWAAIIKNPSLYLENPELFSSFREDTYKELRSKIFKFDSVSDVLNSPVFFTIVRNPIDRFISAYTNRILLLKTSKKMFSISELIENYDLMVNDPDYKDIIHHTRPLSFFCGDDPSVYTHIFNIGQMGEVKSLLEKTYGVTLPDIHLHKSNIEKPTLTKAEIKLLRERYSEDYRIYGKWLDQRKG